MKLCSKCKLHKDNMAFSKDASRPSGLYPSCLLCCAKRYKKSHELFPDRAKMQSRKQHKLHPERNRNKYLKAFYGISLDEYNALAKKQDNRCALCFKHRDEMKKALCVDHDHKSNQVRGLLCFECNVMLGMARDNISVLNNSIQYLQRFA